MAFDIRSISPAQARPVRQAILRPRETPEEQVYPGDDEPDSLHVGAFQGEKLVAVVTVVHEPSPGESDPRAWRLRGMATVPDARRQGVGTRLVRAVIAHVAAHGGTSLWCHGRTSALNFYNILGFHPEGREYEIGTGPHILMRRAILPHEK